MTKPLTRIEALRRGKGLSQMELAHLLGLKGNTPLSLIENRKLAGYPKLRRGVAEILKVDENVIFDEAGFARLAVVRTKASS